MVRFGVFWRFKVWTTQAFREAQKKAAAVLDTGDGDFDPDGVIYFTGFRAPRGDLLPDNGINRKRFWGMFGKE